MSLFKDLTSLHARFSQGIEKVAGGTLKEIKGLFDSDHRHDDPEEKARDEARARILEGHRFKSFAQERDGNICKWHVDGHDFMWALAEIIDSAKEHICILDWWLSPELYLKRPPAHFPEWRLDRLLQKKAQQGVKVHVIVYKEVTQTMSMSSNHTKKALEALHPNIAVMRHPDHIGSKDSIQFWSHHEKVTVVIVDYHYASIGGLDLCFGRWDTHSHPLADAHVTEHDRTLFPGQDYNNARVLDFQKVDHYVSNQISTLETGRMPWHDVHMTIVGPSVLDIAQHFIERWNEVKKRKYQEMERYPWLAFPHDISASPNEPIASHPDFHAVARRGVHYKERFLRRMNDHDAEEDPDDHSHDFNKATCRVQVVRSISDWSHGYLTEHSIQNAYIQLINEAKHFIYIENQFFISNTVENAAVVNQIAGALVNRILTAAKAGEKFKVIIVIPEVPAFAGDIKDASAVQIILGAQYRTINRGGDSIMEKIRAAGYNPEDYVRWYHLRAYDRINGPYSTFIKQMEEKTGVTFHQAQVALARKWIGKIDEAEIWVQDTVAIKAPVPTKDGIVEEGDASKTEDIKYPETEEEADRILKTFEAGAGRKDDEVSDSVGHHAMQDITTLHDERWLGDEAEERDCYITELLYIHSKVMIVDDRRVIMGSANLNDRSQKGDGDSEIALVVEDSDMINSRMNGQPYKAARFAATLRRALFKEHLGLIKPQHCEPETVGQVTSYMTPVPHPHKDTTMSREDQMVADPLSDEFEQLWNNTAHKNTQVFSEIFKTVPSNNVRNWNQYEAYVPKVKAGHIAATEMPLQTIKDKLNSVQGHLVEGAVDFLIEEPGLTTGVRWAKYDPTLPIYI
ncbi:Phospholipase D1 Short=PLD 1; AltName: Full=Choline phosphatase 1; AltName: Full=Meiosis-specific sporulation-specific protein 14; AltName: Full=Phosphatidylcholine-hydrolyzing phospholipase D1 [Serendipita indica DSM 11827]|uniref:Phospholipase n=1 Tax=Serendipita indica (strain DSM 11827) TaxID=1109443 RepID=G4TL29_SERID|nr:Phospholipase D1 Short=PLD 1; AltName: Full=Choline phosphatase 1; AltName: Full=Meiosis-specific sporulation-specific protein 14; AltName: Full=Phosphatidylcholine-hydrolyzing phospholipase D1 [Serendipita indica DSM 11827]CCA72015.1 related to phospholipase D [Serendipita indica DSM 11827]